MRREPQRVCLAADARCHAAEAITPASADAIDACLALITLITLSFFRFHDSCHTALLLNIC